MGKERKSWERRKVKRRKGTGRQGKENKTLWNERRKKMWVKKQYVGKCVRQKERRCKDGYYMKPNNLKRKRRNDVSSEIEGRKIVWMQGIWIKKTTCKTGEDT